MKFLKYLSESGFQGSTISTESAAIQFAKKYCKQNMTKYPVLYKGITRADEDDTYMIVKPSKHERESANTRNYYTWMIDKMFKEWKQYPKRSKSVICSTSDSTAENYTDGNIYVVIPVDGSKIGVCPDNDIWSSFDSITQIFVDLSDFNHFLTKVFEKILKKNAPETFEDFSKNVKDLDIFLIDFHKENVSNSKEEYDNYDSDGESDYEEPDFDSSMDAFVEMFIGGDDDNLGVDSSSIKYILRGLIEYKSFTKWFEHLLDPSDNHFDLHRSLKSLSGYDDRECWTDGDCLYVDVDKYNEFYEAVTND